MSKYGVMDVFNLNFYDVNGFLFDLNNVKDMIIERNLDTKENLLVVRDAVLDDDIFDKVFNGYFDNKPLRIVGNSVFRRLDNKDYDASLNVGMAILSKYVFPMNVERPSVIKLVFEFPTRYDGFKNAVLKIDSEERE